MSGGPSSSFWSRTIRTTVLLTQAALRSGELRARTQVAATGEEALAYLEGRRPFQDRERHPLPALILLDPGLPGISGLEALSCLQDRPVLRGIPALVLTVSMEPGDARRAFALGARRFLPKPEDFTEVARMVRKMLPPWPEAPGGAQRGRAPATHPVALTYLPSPEGDRGTRGAPFPDRSSM